MPDKKFDYQLKHKLSKTVSIDKDMIDDKGFDKRINKLHYMGKFFWVLMVLAYLVSITIAVHFIPGLK